MEGLSIQALKSMKNCANLPTEFKANRLSMVSKSQVYRLNPEAAPEGPTMIRFMCSLVMYDVFRCIGSGKSLLLLRNRRQTLCSIEFPCAGGHTT